VTILSQTAGSNAEPPTADPPDRGRARRGVNPTGVRYVLGRVAGSLGSLFFMLVVNFFLFRVLPGDPVRTLARNRLVSAKQMADLRRTLGLTQPLPQQFLTYLHNTFTGQFGISYKYRVPVGGLILDRLWPTVVLVGTGTLLATVVGLRIGIHSAWERGGRFDRWTTGASLTLYSMPEWWLGLMLLAVIGVGIGPLPGLFPAGGLISPGLDPWSLHGILDQAWHLTLPVITLALAYLAEYSLIMRSSLLDEMGQDYLLTARAKGLRDAVVREHHAVRNALLPATTLVALNLGFVVSGAITIETVFSIPGLGLLTTDALSVPDFPLLQGTFLFFSAAVIVANLAANLLYSYLDPRVRG
jgi:peptide/nickel transport system permease protein